MSEKVLYLFPKRSLTFSKGPVSRLTQETSPLPFVVAQLHRNTKLATNSTVLSGIIPALSIIRLKVA
ncbi:hypothetical protein NC99_43470 [Sunxiuqinia dokdonensis]|uniref:Uncharacterized protein n=1 Tax=Sunxiuqinia dokdonensis TaxID=1409788 RepID=A0A0L8V393_9BACT|nr:hypothetical protein NC99_43470 [Sunxiuqinia dokdonensis]